jgi:thymidylate synthase
MELIKRQTSPAVWLAAVEHLDKTPKGEDLDVILHVAEPTVLTAEDLKVYGEVDRFLTSHGAFSVHTVAETIFPLDEYQRSGVRGVFDTFPEKLRSIQKSRDDGNWGSYAYRILRQRDAEGKIFNPLEDLLAKIKAHGKYRASFELGAGRPFEDEVQFYDPATDRKRLYGGPCLSHLSIKVHDGRLRFNATYRSHYYVRRLLGNLVGLGRLQFFLAHEAGIQVGGLTVNSTFARLDTGSGEGSGGSWSKSDARALIARARSIYDSARVAA